MTLELTNGNCLELMKKIPEKSIDLMICDLPYGETNCKWDIKIDMEEFWKEFKRIRKSSRVACIHFCSTKFGYQLIKSWEKGFKMDMVWKKRNKTGGLQSRQRPMRNHEMVYFFYDQAPKYNRDKYHTRIQQHKEPYVKSEEVGIGKTKKAEMNAKHFDPPNPASVLEESQKAQGRKKYTNTTLGDIYLKKAVGPVFDPPNPASVLEESDIYGEIKSKRGDRVNGLQFEPPNPASVVEEDDEFVEQCEDEPLSMFESTKVFIGKRHHQTEKPIDILEFFIKYWTDEGDTILDPTMGSGSTGVAAKGLKRNFIGFELNEDIFKVAQGRIEKQK